MAVIYRPSLLSISSLTAHKLSAKPKSLIPKTLIQQPSQISISSSENRCYPLFQKLYRCTSSDISLEDENPPSTRIFIKGLPRTTSEGCLAKIFSHFGTVRRVKIITDKKTKQSLGFAYLWFTCEEDAQLAAREMDGKFVDGRFIIVKIARPESLTNQIRATPYQF